MTFKLKGQRENDAALYGLYCGMIMIMAVLIWAVGLTPFMNHDPIVGLGYVISSALLIFSQIHRIAKVIMRVGRAMIEAEIRKRKKEAKK